MVERTVDIEVHLKPAGIIIHPGDTLIVVMPAETSMYELAESRARLGVLLPECRVVVIAGAEQLAVYRPARPGETPGELTPQLQGVAEHG